MNETFGPIIGVAAYRTLDEAITLANAPGYGLSASIYTTDPAKVFAFRRRISAGMVSVNNSTSGAEAHLPFGGNGRSGNGSRQSGLWVLDQFTRWQSMNWDYSGRLQKAQMDVVEITPTSASASRGGRRPRRTSSSSAAASWGPASRSIRRGRRDVVLVERDELGSGSTCKAAGGVRAQFSDEVNIRLGARSLEAFARFGERPGQEIDLHRVGYLFLLSRPDEVASFERSVAWQNELGVPSRMISVDEARKRSPLISTDGLLAAAFSPTTGTARPNRSSSGMRRARGGTARRSIPTARSSASRRSAARSRRSRHRGAASRRPRSSAQPGRGRRWSARWRASTCRWNRCAARSCSPSRCPICPGRCR